mgnify:CR=1 FL=1
MSKKFDLLANKFRSTCTKYKLNSIDDNECGNQLKNILTDLNESINNEINTFSGNNYELGYKRIGNKNLFFPDDIKNLKDGKLKNMITILYVFLDKKNNDINNKSDKIELNGIDNDLKKKIEELLKKLK